MTHQQTSALAAFLNGKAVIKGVAERLPDNERQAFAAAFCHATVGAYWEGRCALRRCTWPVQAPRWSPAPLPEALRPLPGTLGRSMCSLPSERAGFLISSLYTALLPDELRALLGAFYTPPPLTRRLLDLVTMAGVDWTTALALDPACGGGAFMAPMARRMWRALKERGARPEEIVASIAARLRGVEVDPVAAWMSAVLLEAELFEVCLAAGTRLPSLIEVGDALDREPSRDEDRRHVVVGNPPYGKVRLDAGRRARFGRSLFGHANLYGLFTDLAVRWTRPGGLIGYVTPTSFLGGQYFKALRGLLLDQAPPVAVDFVTDRTGVFDDVLQETMLAVYRRSAKDRSGVTIHFLRPNGHESRCAVQTVGRFLTPAHGDAPWLLPRQRDQVALLEKVQQMSDRLADYGFGISTGPLVWNRHKPQLKPSDGPGRLPLIWSEAVGSWGFRFSAERRDHMPFFEVRQDQEFLVIRNACVLVQRTTAKEQKRRVIAALLPEEFIARHSGVVVENHLNVIRPTSGDPLTSLRTLCTLLNSTVVDQVFRCINGSVAVSAYELGALPLPNREMMAKLDMLVTSGAQSTFIEQFIASAYGVRDATSLAA
jgi:hypothetical protein